MPTRPIPSSRTYRAMLSSSIGRALPSINTTSWPGGVSACSRNIQRWGMKLRVTPLSGLYSKIFIASFAHGVLGELTRDGETNGNSPADKPLGRPRHFVWLHCWTEPTSGMLLLDRSGWVGSAPDLFS